MTMPWHLLGHIGWEANPSNQDSKQDMRQFHLMGKDGNEVRALLGAYLAKFYSAPIREAVKKVEFVPFPDGANMPSVLSRLGEVYDVKVEIKISFGPKKAKKVKRTAA